ncbi:MAG: hypothetical protein EB015_12460 [Methylocystaceae bacterium]|nr:hypothetical protein [Methylocystaceae bacterium]
MAKKLWPIAETLARLIVAFEDHADVALLEQKRSKELHDELVIARENVRPVFTYFVRRLGDDYDALEALWCLLSCTTTIVDPDKHKAGLIAVEVARANAKKNINLNKRRELKHKPKDLALDKAVRSYWLEIKQADFELNKETYFKIFDATLRNLGEAKRDDGWPSNSTVRRCIRKIKSQKAQPKK